jgi:ATP-dependent DNA helicase RecG
MTAEQLPAVLALGENQRVEFKTRARDLSQLGRIVCGLLNSGGGYVVCGVGDGGDVIGIPDAAASAQRIEEGLRDRLSPRALVSARAEPLEGREVIVIEVPAGRDLPYAFRNAIFVRDGSRTRTADVATIRDLVLRHQVEPERWERRFSVADIDLDLDRQEVHAAVEAIRDAHRVPLRNADEPIAVLEDLAAARYGRLTNAGDVLFCRNPAVRYPQVRVRAASFTDDRAGDRYQDLKSFEGPLVPVLEQAYNFIVRNTATRVEFSPRSLARQETPAYPAAAVREALVNALAHRDYASSSGGVSVFVYPSRLEIRNSGGLPEGITPELLGRGTLSVLRNPDIAHVLYLRGLMEKLGRGTLAIVRACQEAGLPEPRWAVDLAGVTLTFFTPEVAPEVIPEVTPEVTPEGLRLLRAMEGEQTRQELQRALTLRDDEHFRKAYLKPALEAGLIERTLPDKPHSSRQRYRLTAAGRSRRDHLRP